MYVVAVVIAAMGAVALLLRRRPRYVTLPIPASDPYDEPFGDVPQCERARGFR